MCSPCGDFLSLTSAPIHSSALIFQRLAAGDGALLSNGLMHVGNVVRKWGKRGIAADEVSLSVK